MTINIDNTKALERIAGALESIDKKLEGLQQAAIDNNALKVALIEAAFASVTVLRGGVRDIIAAGDNRQKGGNNDANG